MDATLSVHISMQLLNIQYSTNSNNYCSIIIVQLYCFAGKTDENWFFGLILDEHSIYRYRFLFKKLFGKITIN